LSGREARRGEDLARLRRACNLWAVAIEAFADAEYSVVAYVRKLDGSAAVAKVPPPGSDSAKEADALAAWGGIGAAGLLDRSADGVLLLDRIEPGTPAPDDATVAATLRRLWIEPPKEVRWRTAAALTTGWVASLERWRGRLGGPVVAAAVEALRAGFGSDPRLLHGDGHHGNVLDGGARGFLAIDPQPLVGPPALDLAPALWNGPEGRTAERIAILAAAAGVDAAEVARLALPRAALSAAWIYDDGEPTDWGERALSVARDLV
jgi:streptomycin 6-kinase